LIKFITMRISSKDDSTQRDTTY